MPATSCKRKTDANMTPNVTNTGQSAGRGASAIDSRWRSKSSTSLRRVSSDINIPVIEGRRLTLHCPMQYRFRKMIVIASAADMFLIRQARCEGGSDGETKNRIIAALLQALVEEIPRTK